MPGERLRELDTAFRATCAERRNSPHYARHRSTRHRSATSGAWRTSPVCVWPQCGRDGGRRQGERLRIGSGCRALAIAQG